MVPEPVEGSHNSRAIFLKHSGRWVEHWTRTFMRYTQASTRLSHRLTMVPEKLSGQKLTQFYVEPGIKKRRFLNCWYWEARQNSLWFIHVEPLIAERVRPTQDRNSELFGMYKFHPAYENHSKTICLESQIIPGATTKSEIQGWCLNTYRREEL